MTLLFVINLYVFSIPSDEFECVILHKKIDCKSIDNDFSTYSNERTKRFIKTARY